MKKIALSMAALATIALVSFDTKSAAAAHGFYGIGLRVGGANVQLDIGNPRTYGPRKSAVYHTARKYTPIPRQRYDYHWHDLSHYDYLTNRSARYGNRCDYVPNRYGWYQDGNYDRYPRPYQGRPHSDHRR